MDRERFARRRAKWEARRMRRCQRGPERGIIFGAVAVGLGMLALLHNVGIQFARDLWLCWPVLIVGVGIARGLSSERPSVVVTASLISAAGTLLLLRNLDVVSFDLRMIWPVVIISIGLVKLTEVLDPRREMASK